MRLTQLLALLLVSLVLFTGCGGDGDSGSPSETRIDDALDLDPNDLLASGQLTGQNGYATSGTMQLYFNSPASQYTLLLEDFSTEQGPALFVYLSQGRFALNFQNLGELKALNGTLRYDFPQDQFNSSFDYVLIWCEQVGQSFGESEIIL